ncbi:MAG: aminotransferase class I/II-fold pyridoxal phosphate-dependent enzyme, partial [Gemmatimonadetes bacterium]|nr:aminotransferase class I/II-fold pyridoxal phosphate-dependent enzyme [Gemmatimonadota bacterium]
MVLYKEADVSGSTVNEGLNRRLVGELAGMQEQGVYKSLLHIMGMQGAVVQLEEFGETVNLCSNNYVGLCDVPEVIEAVRDGASLYGAGTASVRFICGTWDIHRELEDRIADF